MVYIALCKQIVYLAAVLTQNAGNAVNLNEVPLFIHLRACKGAGKPAARQADIAVEALGDPQSIALLGDKLAAVNGQIAALYIKGHNVVFLSELAAVYNNISAVKIHDTARDLVVVRCFVLDTVAADIFDGERSALHMKHAVGDIGTVRIVENTAEGFPVFGVIYHGQVGVCALFKGKHACRRLISGVAVIHIKAVYIKRNIAVILGGKGYPKDHAALKALQHLDRAGVGKLLRCVKCLLNGGILCHRFVYGNRRLIAVRSKYRQRHHGKYHDDRQQHGKYPLFQCHVCVHLVTPLHASCNRRREDLRGNRLFMKIRTAEPVGLRAESVIIRKPQHRDVFADAFGGDHALHAVCAVHRYHDAVRRAFSESCDKAVIIQIACYLHFTVT